MLCTSRYRDSGDSPTDTNQGRMVEMATAREVEFPSRLAADPLLLAEPQQEGLVMNDYTTGSDRQAPEDVAKLREALLDPEVFSEMAGYFALKSAQEESVKYPEQFVEIWKILIWHNNEVIKHCCESEIETIFFRSILLHLVSNLVPVVFTPGPDDSEQFIEYISKVLGVAKKVSQKRIKDLGFVEACKHFSSIDDFASGTYFILSLISEPMEVVHITLQANLSDVMVNGRKIRADALVWSAIEKQRFVVECDGFQFHSTKDKFILDRQKDRALAAAGYKILRFSGSEIYNDPPQAPIDLLAAIKPLVRAERKKTDRKKKKSGKGLGFGGAS